MHVVIGGGSGFIGTALTQFLRSRGDEITWISREPGLGRITWDRVARDGLPACDAVVNLAGAHILDPRRRWTPAYRDEVIASRVRTTETLVRAINASVAPPEVFVSTAGKCFYGSREMGAGAYPELDEESEPMGVDFPAELVALWERAADAVDGSRVRHVKVRVGIVLGSVRRASVLGRLWRIGRTRGFLPMVRLPFCLGVGAVIGKGTQPFPWVHVDDMVGLVVHALDDRSLRGRYNAVSPGIVTSEEFIRAFARHLRRPVAWRVPEGLVTRFVGTERASILLEGQLVRPRRTLASGYSFRFPTIDRALGDLVEITV